MGKNNEPQKEMGAEYETNDLVQFLADDLNVRLICLPFSNVQP